MTAKMQIGIVAPSSKLPKIEFNLGLDQIREAGLSPIVHPQCKKSWLFFAGTDEERALAFFEYAVDPRFSVVWSARGGYGAARILPYLEKLTAERGVPDRKLFMGYSDATVLMEYVRNRWGWATLHAPMPAMRKFCLQTPAEWNSLLYFIRGSTQTKTKAATAPWEKKKLHFINGAPKSPIEAELVGGNLAVWTSLIGTPYAPRSKGKMLFLEDVDEPLYRLDRMLQQLVQSGSLKDVQAILLGNFLNCKDTVARVIGVEPKGSLKTLLENPKPEQLKLLRKKLDERRGLREIFGEVGDRLGIPVAEGLPVGHGPGIAALPLGAQYRLDRKGQLKLLDWDWLEP
jgi:muramoyltetrapeptide carboxypeptidase